MKYMIPALLALVILVTLACYIVTPKTGSKDDLRKNMTNTVISVIRAPGLQFKDKRPSDAYHEGVLIQVSTTTHSKGQVFQFVTVSGIYKFENPDDYGYGTELVLGKKRDPSTGDWVEGLYPKETE